MKMDNSCEVCMRQDVTKTHTTQNGKKKTDLLKSGLLWMEADMSVGIDNVGVDSKFFDS